MLVRISSQNSLENFKDVLSFRTYEGVSFILPTPYANLKRGLKVANLIKICQNHVGIM